jgi:hypothetical protein
MTLSADKLQPHFETVPQRTNYRYGIQTVAPPWLQDDASVRFLYTMAIQLDAIAEYLRIGVLQRFPGRCQPDALAYIGSDRQIFRGFQEADAGYAERLRKAFPTWKFAGNAPTLLRQLSAYFAPDPPKIRYVASGLDQDGNPVSTWWTAAEGTGELSYYRADPANWNWDGDFEKVRFWIIFYLPELTPWYVGDGHVVGGGQSVGFTEDGAFVRDLRAIIAKFKCDGSHAGTFPTFDAGIILTTSDMEAAITVGSFDVGDGSHIGETHPVEAFNPFIQPGPPMPNGDWDDPANRFSGAFYASGI